MMITKRILLSIFLVLVLPVIAHAKPQSPLKVFIDSDAMPAPGSIFAFRVTVQSAIDVQGVRLDLQLPQGADLVIGTAHNNFDLERGKARVLEYQVNLPQIGGGIIVVTASAGNKTSMFYRARDEMVIPAAKGLVKPQTTAPTAPAYQLRERQGEVLREYKQ